MQKVQRNSKKRMKTWRDGQFRPDSHSREERPEHTKKSPLKAWRDAVVKKSHRMPALAELTTPATGKAPTEGRLHW